ncbi:heat shock protein Hsp20 [bacterium A37T11]|nr:heat shock protein Hsp20 [bacterium A37T11]
MTLVKFNGNQHKAVNPWVNNLFDSLFTDSLGRDPFVAKVPAVNIAEKEDAYQIELAAPGLAKEDFKINVEDDVLTISAEKKSESEEEGKRYSKREYSYSSFQRSFTLPDSIDQEKIEASYKDGVLFLTVAKKEEAKVVAKQIEVK